MSIAFNRMVSTVDSHTEGNPTRVIIGGVKTPPGTNLLECRDWLMANDDALRTMLNFEPRGNGMMCSVLLVPPIDPEADAAAIIMEQDKYVPMCGHCIIGVATTLVSTGRVKVNEPMTEVTIETAAGLIKCQVAVSNRHLREVTFTNVESFLLESDIKLKTHTYGTISVDIAYGGDFYTMVNGDDLGLDLSAKNEPALIRCAAEVREAVAEQVAIKHPERPDINECYQVQFISAKTTDPNNHARNAVVAPPGALDRSPCGTGTSARVASLYAKRLLTLNESFRNEGPLGTTFIGHAVSASERNGVTYVTAAITGHAYITGFHTFVLDPDDPFPDGFRVG